MHSLDLIIVTDKSPIKGRNQVANLYSWLLQKEVESRRKTVIDHIEKTLGSVLKVIVA